MMTSRHRSHKVIDGTALGDPTPPIVSEELWEKANKIVTGKKFKRASRPFEHWLRGRVVCMDCDVKMGLVWLANK